MTAGAAERVTDIARKTVASGEKKRSSAQSGRPVRAIPKLGIRGNTKWNALFLYRLLRRHGALRIGSHVLARNEQERAC